MGCPNSCAADRRSASTRALLLGRPPQARAPCPFPADLLPLMEAPVADRPELFRKKLAVGCRHFRMLPAVRLIFSTAFTSLPCVSWCLLRLLRAAAAVSCCVLGLLSPPFLLFIAVSYGASAPLAVSFGLPLSPTVAPPFCPILFLASFCLCRVLFFVSVSFCLILSLRLSPSSVACCRALLSLSHFILFPTFLFSVVVAPSLLHVSASLPCLRRYFPLWSFSLWFPPLHRRFFFCLWLSSVVSRFRACLLSALTEFQQMLSRGATVHCMRFFLGYMHFALICSVRCMHFVVLKSLVECFLQAGGLL